MGVQLTCSVILLNKTHRHVLGAVCSHGDSAHYLYHAATHDVDLGRYSLQCGRRNDALKLWLAWREIGDSGWEGMIDGYLALAEYLEQRVELEPNLEMMSSRQWTNVCFRYKFSGATTANEKNLLNSALREQLMHEGKYMMSKANIHDDIILRPVVSNPKASKSTLDGLLNEILRIGAELNQQRTGCDDTRDKQPEDVVDQQVISASGSVGV